MANPYILVIGSVLGVSAVLLFVPVTAAPVRLWPTELGYLRRGPKGAVLTALTGLYLQGVIEPRLAGGLRRTDEPRPDGGDWFERVVYDTLVVPAGWRAVVGRPAVYWAGRELAKRLARAGLVPGPFRAIAGRAMLVAAPGLGAMQVDTAGPAPLGAAVVMSLALGLASRRTIAGHLALRKQRREHARLLAAWRPPKHGQYADSADMVGPGAVPTAPADSVIATKGCALGMTANLAVLGVPEVVFGGGHGSADSYDGAGGYGGDGGDGGGGF